MCYIVKQEIFYKPTCRLVGFNSVFCFFYKTQKLFEQWNDSFVLNNFSPLSSWHRHHFFVIIPSLLQCVLSCFPPRNCHRKPQIKALWQIFSIPHQFVYDFWLHLFNTLLTSLVKVNQFDELVRSFNSSPTLKRETLKRYFASFSPSPNLTRKTTI